MELEAECLALLQKNECRLCKFGALLLPPFFQEFAEAFHNLLHILDTDALNGDRTGW